MSTAIIGWPIRSDVGVSYTPVLAGGSWLAALPLTNLQDRALKKVARSTTAALADTRFRVDLGVDREVRVIAIPKHTLSLSGKWKVTGYPSTMLFAYEAGDDITLLGGVFSRADASTCATYLDAAGLVKTVAANVLRDSHYIGAFRHVLLEQTRANVALHNRDMTNAAWTKTTMTAAKDQVGADGVSNAASSLLATAGNATCLQAIVLASSARYQTAYVKRLIGTGTVQMTTDNGTTWTTITLTAAWTRVSIPTQTLANPTVGFRIVTSGDKIAVDYVQNENGPNQSSVIPTTTAAVTRAGDLLYFPYTALPQNHTLYVKWTEQGNVSLAANATLAYIGSAVGGTATFHQLVTNTSGNLTSNYNDGTGYNTAAVTGPALAQSAEARAALQFGGNNTLGVSLNAGAESTQTVAMPASPTATWADTRLYLNSRGTTQVGINAFRSLRVMTTAVSLATIQSSVLDSGWVDAWPAGITAETGEGMNLPLVHIPASSFTGRYFSFQFSDASNVAGYVDLARAVVAAGYQPTVNVKYGVKLGLETDTTKTKMSGGAAVYDVKPVARNATFIMDELPIAEALANGFDLQRIAGTSRQMYFVFDPSDAANMHRTSFLAVLRELSAVEIPYHNSTSTPFALVEEL